MNYLIIECHPYSDSFTACAAKAIEAVLVQKGDKVRTVNLVTDGFDPVMREGDLKLWGKGQTADSKATAYQKEIEAADIIVFPFPLWWGTMPAILKGFCDKVLLPGWAYKNENGKLVGLLAGKKAIVINTMQAPTQVYKGYFGNPIEGAFIKDTLQTCGFEVLKHIIIDGIISGGRENAEAKMKEIIAYFEGLD